MLFIVMGIFAINKAILRKEQEIIMVGDGYTDYETYKNGAVDMFICYTENIHRKDVAEKSDHIANNFNEVINTIT